MLEHNKVFACRHKDENIRYNSTSGGMFSALSEYVIGQYGYVVGVRYNQNFQSEHSIASTLEECKQFVGSKYSQSFIGDIYIQVKNLLEAGALVLFTGTPCQVAALHSVLNKNYENLISVDLICMGIASPGVWQSYLDYEFAGQTIKSINLKDKRFGWHRFSVKIDAENKQIHEVGGQNVFMNAYVSGKLMRKSCYQCPFKGKNRFSDLTIADCWGIEQIDPSFDDNKGVSVVFVNTQIGCEIFQRIANSLDFFEITQEQATKYNVYYNICRPLTKERDKFLLLFRKNPVECFKKNNPHSFVFKVKAKLQRLWRN
ncbi:coenzyme F420-reducing hydrogenase subunit beta [Sporomusa ovata DSM 2662]|uniref:Related to F420H2-dehydrogenase, beta subunit n=1 Tax=Sporomusa ovata TaxID=2378 RepID=A0A0U1KTD9_9FIRM|nr:Coenzyme F420 hydrogenase/dehydrogenase, beta subunit C-terminal domain [Sporomusa ovata]EQB26441.1 4Fe-4S binding domain containing protein [Sporomusa ovata DSM 2662]CQR70525.1 Related to F420H2-dehydrogenase, beta subunit [Sporomusa ovata]